MVAVKARLANRFKRRVPEENEDKKTFLKRDKIDIEQKGLGTVIENADFVLQNNSSKAALFKKTLQLLQKISKRLGKAL